MNFQQFVKSLISTIILFAILFLSAGRIDYWQGIVYAVTGLVMLILNHTILKIDSDLLKERAKPIKDAKKWDKIILLLSLLCNVAMYIVAGLDSGRYGWSPEFHISLIIIGFIMTITGHLLFLIAQKQNKFFSNTIRIQKDRGHTVCKTGLYKFVRHPAYLGSVIQAIGFPLLMCSLYSIIPVFLLVILLLLRTYLEDKTLQAELEGYRQYIDETKYKIVPFIW